MKKPVKTKLTLVSDIFWWRCPTCKNAVALQIKDTPLRTEHKIPQCKHCGEELDWSDTK